MKGGVPDLEIESEVVAIPDDEKSTVSPLLVGKKRSAKERIMQMNTGDQAEEPVKEVKKKRVRKEKADKPETDENKQKRPTGEELTECGKYLIQENKKGGKTLKPLAVCEILNRIKDEVYETYEDLQGLVDELNETETRSVYHIHFTPKYAVLACCTCPLFKAWFKSETGQDMATFCEVREKHLFLLNDAKPKFKLFRKINLGHDAAKHIESLQN